ncbi:efflux RND transporter permease subunit [Lachnoclostridium phytofermentans]|uniref:Membrane transport protein MMPL domain-containing protein n=1 Tax=Lachnoclostridium phytofermentans (strain ATCC 700394 / DSM 18823 / ISDg) TaxID=357809 RepID=A9KHJ3_LACP7|nr:efflux RND transporter permease subunit [Lachnoclostridium phytofermentans]ABX42278.1 conserved hypothetical protein [Lachnoclostridium phytofermentans ISDg]
MIRFGKFVTKHKKLILVLGILLLIPSFIGMICTRINYDVLTYLPKDTETMIGQDILVNDFGIGAFSMVIVENMPDKDVVKLKEKIKEIDHVKDILWYDDAFSIDVPISMLPDKIKDAFNSENSTMMVVLYDGTTSADSTMNAIGQIRKVTGEQVFVSGMSALVTDTRDLSNQETPIYVLIAVALSLLVLCISMEYFLVPFLFLISIGMAIVYNLGSNIIFGEISYITKALSAVLQLGVTMDYSIFLLHSYEENKLRYPDDKDRAMSHAISNTFSSVVGSSITTVAGFIALCFMSFTLGKDIGLVMAKGVVFGVLACVTVLPSMILLCDKWIEKTKHRNFLPDLKGLSTFVTKHYLIFVVAFVVLLIPAIYGNNHTDVYYNLDESLPKDLKSVIANDKLKEDYNMDTTIMLLLKSDLSQKNVDQLMSEIQAIDGIEWTLGIDKLIGPALPISMIPDRLISSVRNNDYQVEIVTSSYKVATDEVNNQIDQINQIVKKYSKDSLVVGEAPLTKDLITIADTDFKTVSIVSIVIIFLIILVLFKSISLPVILVSVIQLAIFINMGIPYYTGTQLPFVASIVIGTIQLGATVDYAILMTTRYRKERNNGKNKVESVTIAHETSIKSVFVSALSFFAATFGVGLYSNIDMISSLCSLMSRGALISMVVVIFILPSMFMLFDRIICKTSIGFLSKKEAN